MNKHPIRNYFEACEISEPTWNAIFARDAYILELLSMIDQLSHDVEQLEEELAESERYSNCGE